MRVEDPRVSAEHAVIQHTGQHWEHKDLGSKNGTYGRVQGEREMNNGDFVFIGRELLRVDITV